MAESIIDDFASALEKSAKTMQKFETGVRVRVIFTLVTNGKLEAAAKRYEDSSDEVKQSFAEAVLRCAALIPGIDVEDART